MDVVILERDEAGNTRRTRLNKDTDSDDRLVNAGSISNKTDTRVLKALSAVFLPSGFPDTVSSVRYGKHTIAPSRLSSIYNSVQAFCSSLAGLIASRATLEGFGVGNASASATHALLLTVLQDVFSRLTTIVAAHYLGTSLFPEAKTYRLLADFLNDAAITLNALSPLLSTVHIPFCASWLFPESGSGLQMVALCLSGAMGALCGLAAGGSKSSLTLHFATPDSGKGDMGELSAKDASKETVLSLLGMLLGSILVPRLVTRGSTYTVLFLLLAGHLTANYIAVRGIVLRTLNRQRAGIAWSLYRQEDFAAPNHLSVVTQIKALSPKEIASRERIFGLSDALRNGCTGEVMGRCSIGLAFSYVSPARGDHRRLLHIFEKERFILCIDQKHDLGKPGWKSKKPRLHICLKDGHTPSDHLKAWAHAEEFGRAWTRRSTDHPGDANDLIEATYQIVNDHFPAFVEHMGRAGWRLGEGALMTGAPKSTLLLVDEDAPTLSGELKKDI